MKGLMVFEDISMADEFPAPVIANLSLQEEDHEARGRLYFKSEELEKIDRDIWDKEGGYIEDQSTGTKYKPSAFFYQPCLFLRDGDENADNHAPLCAWFEVDGVRCYIYLHKHERATGIRGTNGEKVALHIVPFSSEETEMEWMARMDSASEEERDEIYKWQQFSAMG